MKFGMTAEEIENKLKVLSHIVDDDYVEAINEARKYISNAATTIDKFLSESKPEWIPCSERLPSEGENVLLCGTFLGNVAIGKLIKYNTSCCWEVDHWDYDIEDWQAWMPLPEPYIRVEK